MKIFHFLKFWHWPKKIFAVLIIAAIATFIFWPKSNPQTQYEYATAQISDLKSVISASGTITGDHVANLKFTTSGKLAYLNVALGDTVKKNQTIGGLDTQDLNIQLQQAYNSFRDKNAAAKKIEDDVKNNDSGESFTQAMTRTTAQVARDNAYDAIKLAQRAFQDAVLTTPISGTVTKAPIKAGSFISPTDTIAQIVDFSKVVFEAEVDEADIPQISLGQAAEVILNAYDNQVFSGTVYDISPTTKTTDSGATVVIVKIDLTGSKITPIYGLNGQTDIILSKKQRVLNIPTDALREDNTVLVKTDNGFRVQPVTTADKSLDAVEITSGLKDGDQVITNPPPPQATTPSTNPVSRFFGNFNKSK